MRKMVVEMDASKFVDNLESRIFEMVESIELLEILRLDLEHGVKIVLVEIELKEGHTLDDVLEAENFEEMGVMEISAILKQEGQKYTMVAKRRIPKGFKHLTKQFDMDIIWSTPIIYSNEKLVFSAIGSGDDLRKLLELMKMFGEVTKTTYQKAVIGDHNLLSVLTDKQRDIIKAAKRYGYYEYPRKINSTELAKKVGVSKATVVEHLRKAEGRLMQNILAGY